MSQSDQSEPTPTPVVLVVDDEEDIRALLVTALGTGTNYRVVGAANGREAQQILGDEPVDVAVTDLLMPELDGLGLMCWAQKNSPATQWIILSVQGTFDDAVKAVQLGAFDFITKPMPSLDALKVTVRNALRQTRLVADRERLMLDLEQRNHQLNQQVLQLREACKLLSEQAQTIHDDLRRAELIQRVLLPRTAPDLGPYPVNALYRPSEKVGGDLYDVLRVNEDHAILYVADAAGHGVSAAMLAVLFKHRLHMMEEGPHQPTCPRDVLQMVNRALVFECKAPALFVTAAYAVLDMGRQTLRLASAGHPPVLVRRSSGAVERIFHTGPALGLTSDAQFAEVEIGLTPGDQLLMYTDGLLEAQGVPSTTPDEIARALGENDGEPEHLLQQLLRRAEGGQKNSHTDDVTMVLLGGADSHSSLDNGRSNEAAPRGVAPPTNGVVLVGETNETMFFCLEGSLNWMQANAFHERCLRELDNGRDVVLDLSVCTYMDSTFLGTIQEAAEYADRATGSLHIQGLLPEIRALLEELGLASVLAHADAAMHVLPADLTPVTAEPAGPDDQVRVLRAHEVLASLNESNRKQFGRLVEHLRKELETADSQDE